MKLIRLALPLALVALMPLGLVACDSGTPREQHTGSRNDAATPVDPGNGVSDMKISLLGFDGCPLTPRMKRRLEQAISQLEQHLELVQIDQHALDASDLRRGYPAPTILVNGSDLFGMPPPTSPSMGCRMYDGPDGVPSIDDLVARLRVALNIDASTEESDG